MIDNARVIAALERVRRTDPELAGELSQRLQQPERREVAITPEGVPGRMITPETIVLRTGRPVLAISRDRA